MAFSTPVLFLVFNRPEHTQRVFQQIRRVKPSRLYISADGPRMRVPGEADRCVAVRSIVQQVDWPCSVYTNFREENLGCKRAVREGISWFFDKEEEGIILEDDCLASETFFSFCAQMLAQYRHDDSVMHISGYNPFPWSDEVFPASYSFSRMPFVWGWASWRRAWLRYDDQFSGLNEAWWDAASGLSLLSTDVTLRRYVMDKFQRSRDGELDTWDYAWFYTVLKWHGKSINPAANLVENIGFDQNATRTRKKLSARIQNSAMGFHDTLVHPPDQAPVPILERAFVSAIKSGPGLFIRRLAPGYFFKPLPPLGRRLPRFAKFIPNWINTILLS